MGKISLSALWIISILIPSPAWSQSPSELQPGTYNAPAGTGASVPSKPIGPLIAPLSQPNRLAPIFNQDILNLNQGSSMQQLWLQSQAAQRSTAIPATPGKSTFRIRLPAGDAQLWVNNQLTTQTGLERTFVTPPLEFGSYRYVFRIRWKKIDAPIQEERTVVFQPSKNFVIDFTAKDRANP